MKIISTNEPIHARSMSFLAWKRIYIGARFSSLTLDEQVAALAHEEGHCELHHTEVRIFSLLFLPFLFISICKKQELAADRYAAKKGHANTLIKMFDSFSEGGWLHPSDAERRHHLMKQEHLRNAPVKGNLARQA